MVRIRIGLAVLAFLLVGCFSDEDVGSEEIVIGELSAISGEEASFGVTAHRGIQMAIDEENAAGSIHGRRIKLLLRDTGSSKDRIQELTQELIDKYNAFAVIGEAASDRTILAAQVAQKEKVPLITYVSTNPSVTAVGEYIFRACYIDPFQGSAMAKFAFQDLNLKRIAVVKDKDSNYSMGLAEYFVDRFQQLGGEIVYDGSYTRSSLEFHDQLNAIKRQKPDALFIPGFFMQAAEIAKQASKMNINAKFLGGDAWENPEILKRSGEAVRGSYYTTHYSYESKNPRSMEFVKNYKQIYGTVPDGTAATGYDAAKMLISAIRRVRKLTREQLRDALAKTADFPGVTGSITLDQNRNAVKPVVVLKIESDKHTYVKTISP